MADAIPIAAAAGELVLVRDSSNGVVDWRYSIT
jgi:hypothetical protein